MENAVAVINVHPNIKQTQAIVGISNTNVRNLFQHKRRKLRRRRYNFRLLRVILTPIQLFYNAYVENVTITSKWKQLKRGKKWRIRRKYGLVVKTYTSKYNVCVGITTHTSKIWTRPPKENNVCVLKTTNTSKMWPGRLVLYVKNKRLRRNNNAYIENMDMSSKIKQRMRVKNNEYV